MKVLFFDIETSPNVVLAFQIGQKINISYENIIEERKIICICWKWLGEDKVYSLDWGPRQNDKKMLVEFAKVVKEADLIVGHNSDKFDIRHVNARTAYHGLNPIGELATVDTLKQTRKTFALNSHRLDYIGQFFGEGKKLDNGGFSLWKRVMQKDVDALKLMIDYCKQDVRLLEKVYNRIQPYVKQSHHRGVLNGDKLACKACGSSHTYWNGSRVYLNTIFRARRCGECGHYWRTGVKYTSTLKAS